MAAGFVERGSVSRARIYVCRFDGAGDVVPADRRRDHAGTANAAENDDLFDARNDAVRDVGFAFRLARLLARRKYHRLFAAAYNQSSQQN